jgi:hypothetical protein
MNLMLKFAMFSCAGLTALGMTGCKVSECTETLPDGGGTTKKEDCVRFETTVEYRDARKREGAQGWTSGRPVSITNRNGPVTVALGNAGDARVQFSGIAFTRETDNAEGEQKAKDRLSKMADPAFAAGDNVTLAAPDGNAVDGYDLTVYIPPDFDAALTVVTNNGKTMISGADGATSTTVTSHEIVMTNMRRTVNLHAKVGDIEARGIPSGPGNSIKAEVGDVTVHLGAANLGITAQTQSGMVNFPMGWNTTVNPDKMSGAATLGDGSGTLSVTSGLGDIMFYAQ